MLAYAALFIAELFVHAVFYSDRSSAASLVFVRYESSPWELEWLSSIGPWRDRECNVLAESAHSRRAQWFIYATQKRLRLPATNQRPEYAFNDSDIYSKFVYRCGSAHEVVRLIEPLVGLLRDPLTMCPQTPPARAGVFQNTESYVQSKRFLLIEPASTVREDLCPSRASNCRRRYLFDVGASIYHGWPGHDGASAVGTKWFVERYAAFNRSFDHIFAFEYEKHEPSLVYADLPPNVLHRYSYMNVGVESAPTSVWNLWNFIAHVARPIDHVTVKLDIAARDVENELMRQLKTNTSIQALVDEMFFEHHVNMAVMNPFWSSQRLRVFLSDTYADYLHLRQRGIRMHSWP